MSPTAIRRMTAVGTDSGNGAGEKARRAGRPVLRGGFERQGGARDLGRVAAYAQKARHLLECRRVVEEPPVPAARDHDRALAEMRRVRAVERVGRRDEWI